MRNLCEVVLKASKEKEEVSIDAEFAKQRSVVRRVEYRLDEKDLSMLKEISISSRVVDLVRRSITVPDIQRTDILQSIAISDGLDFGVQQVRKRLESSSETLAEMLELILVGRGDSCGSCVVHVTCTCLSAEMPFHVIHAWLCYAQSTIQSIKITPLKVGKEIPVTLALSLANWHESSPMPTTPIWTGQTYK